MNLNTTRHGTIDPKDPRVIIVNKKDKEFAAIVIDNLIQIEKVVLKYIELAEIVQFHRKLSSAYWHKLKAMFADDIGLVDKNAELFLDYNDEGTLYILPQKKKPKPFKNFDMGKFNLGEGGIEFEDE